MAGLCRYCAADDRWEEAVKFMNLDDGAGWQLLEVGLSLHLLFYEYLPQILDFVHKV